jgi:mono/diheme cytochrome c family protein
VLNRVLLILSCVVFTLALGVAISAQARQGGWNVPATAKDEKSPLTVNDAVLAGGKRIYEQKCQRCHGKTGKGDGPDAEAEHKEDMDLTVAARAARNPDGVVFYKIWNGRPSPKMPPMSEEATKEQVWAVVAYTQSLRGK